MTPPDDLAVGDWVVVYDVQLPEIDYGDTCSQNSKGPIPPVTGEPFCILAINLPFVGVTNGSMKTAFDVRTTQLRKVDDEYSSVMNSFVNDMEWDYENGKFIPISDALVEEDRTCPYCSEELMRVETKEKWRYICTNSDCKVAQEGVEIYLP